MILLYKDGAVSPPLHPIDANVWVLNGWVVDAPPAIAGFDTLALFNKALTPSDLTPIPSIGRSTANAIIRNRPEAGYATIEAIKEVAGTERVRWADVIAWSP